MRAIALLLASLTAAAFAKAPLMDRHTQDSHADNYIVVLKQGVGRAAIDEHFGLLRSTTKQHVGSHRGLVRTYNINAFNAYHIECGEDMLEEIRSHALVDYISPNAIVKTQGPVQLDSDQHASLKSRDDTSDAPWGLARMSHRKSGGHPLYLGEELPHQTYAYVLDSGIRTTHEFGGRALWGAKFVSEEASDLDIDENGHGTHVAGTIAGNTVGIDNHTIPIAVKVMTDWGYIADIIKGIEWGKAVQHATNASTIARSVINMSIGSETNTACNDAVKHAVEAGMTVVVAAGNDGKNACDFSPAGAREAITVGAIDQDDNRLWNNGKCVDIFAPGQGILSAFKDNDTAYASLQGTSMASPHVAGLVTYLMARETNLKTPAQVRDRIKELATKDKIKSLGDPESPNLIAFNGNSAEL